MRTMRQPRVRTSSARSPSGRAHGRVPGPAHPEWNPRGRAPGGRARPSSVVSGPNSPGVRVPAWTRDCCLRCRGHLAAHAATDVSSRRAPRPPRPPLLPPRLRAPTAPARTARRSHPHLRQRRRKDPDHARSPEARGQLQSRPPPTRPPQPSLVGIRRPLHPRTDPLRLQPHHDPRAAPRLHRAGHLDDVHPQRSAGLRPRTPDPPAVQGVSTAECRRRPDRSRDDYRPATRVPWSQPPIARTGPATLPGRCACLWMAVTGRSGTRAGAGAHAVSSPVPAPRTTHPQTRYSPRLQAVRSCRDRREHEPACPEAASRAHWPERRDRRRSRHPTQSLQAPAPRPELPAAHPSSATQTPTAQWTASCQGVPAWRTRPSHVRLCPSSRRSP